MPEVNIHEKVALELSKKYNLYNRDFFLGNMAPDSVNVFGFAPKEDRWTSHIRRSDREEWRSALKEFYLLEKDNYNKSFILGYITHILTDIVHDDYIYLKQRKAIKKDYNCNNDEAHLILREDMEKYRFSEWKDIINLLKSSDEYYDILNITKELEEKWLNKKTKEYLDNTKSKYQTSKDIDSLILLVSKELEEYI